MTRYGWIENHLNVRRVAASLITCGAVAGTLLVGGTEASAAGKPIGGCPVAYQLTPISQLGRVAANVDAKGNNDGQVCTLPFPGNAADAIGAPYNIIDNTVQGSSSS